MEDILVVHFIAKSHTYGSRRLASVVATALKWAELRTAIDELVRPHIVHECYRLQNAYNFIELSYSRHPDKLVRVHR